jgi:hypothetical protein
METLAQQVLAAIDSWSAANASLVVEKLGLSWRRVRIGPGGPQALNYRATAATHQEPFLDNVSEEEVALLRTQLGRPEAVVYPYGRSTSMGALIRIRDLKELDAIRNVLIKRVSIPS